MRIKLDENLPNSYRHSLNWGTTFDTVPAERIAGEDDAVVWQAAQAGQDGMAFVRMLARCPATTAFILAVPIPYVSMGTQELVLAPEKAAGSTAVLRPI